MKMESVSITMTVGPEFWEDFSEFQEDCYNTAKKSGFQSVPHSTDPDLFNAQVSQSLMLIASEVSEAFEDVRKGHHPAAWFVDDNGKPHGIPSEIADVVIRCMDFAQTYGFDLGTVVRVKAEYNKTRPFKHGKSF